MSVEISWDDMPGITLELTDELAKRESYLRGFKASGNVDMDVRRYLNNSPGGDIILTVMDMRRADFNALAQELRRKDDLRLYALRNGRIPTRPNGKPLGAAEIRYFQILYGLQVEVIDRIFRAAEMRPRH